MNKLHGTITVKGSNPFKIPAEDFIISPLSEDASLYINSIYNNIVNPVKIGEIVKDEYTKVHGAIPYIEFYIDTTNTYYIKW